MEFYIPPLLEIDLELSALNYYLDLLEEQIKKRVHREELEFRTKITELKLTHDDPEWHDEKYQSDYIVEFLLPRLFRGPFLVSLYAVFESAVIEIARLIKKQKRIDPDINELKVRGGFVVKAKQYFKDVIQFPLCSNAGASERITMLLELRNAIAHANGRIEMLKPRTRENIKTWEKQKIGISVMGGFVVFGESFLRDTLSLVHASLNDLIRRYEKWNDNQINP